MVELLTLAVIIIAGTAILLGLIIWRIRIRHQAVSEPIIELEKLINCVSCGSLIPEGVRKCAFCGAWQHQEDSSRVNKNS